MNCVVVVAPPPLCECAFRLCFKVEVLREAWWCCVDSAAVCCIELIINELFPSACCTLSHANEFTVAQRC